MKLWLSESSFIKIDLLATQWNKTPAVHVTLSQNHMATTFHLTVSTVPLRVQAAEEVLYECHRLITDCENEYSEFLVDSPLYQLNHSPIPIERTISTLTRDLFLRAEALRQDTLGAFHYGAKGELEIDPPFAYTAPSLRKLSPKAWIGFGAIGKGYALDKARELIEREGFFDYCLNAGGSSILLSGLSAPLTPWEWGWTWEKTKSHSKTTGLVFRHTSTRPIAIGISGMQEKGSHLIRRHLHNSPEHAPLKSALIAAHSATEADALSTALFVSGWDEFHSLDAVRSRELSTAAIDDEDTPHWNGWFQHWFGPITSLVVGALFSSSALATSEEAVDLAVLGLESFNPYQVERDPLWVLLPVAALLLVLLHLKRKPKPQRTLETRK